MLRRTSLVSQITVFPLLLLAFLSSASAETIGFGSGWKTLDFRGLNATSYSLGSNAVGIRADKSSSVIYRPVPLSARSATKADWSWSVSQSVPATNLAKKGGDDRNIALYFVFTDQRTADRAGNNPNIRRLLTARSSRVLIYVHGGSQARGSFVPSPYFRGRGTTIVKRSAGTGNHSEAVDLAADYARAFGEKPGVLIGLAVSSDSDDTGVVSQSQLGAVTLN